MTHVLRVCVVGTGAFAEVHAATWQRVPGAQLVAVAGRASAVTARFAARHSVRAVSIDAALEKENDLNLIDIVTPTATHAPLGERALAAGRHVLVEKPMAGSLARAIALANHADKSDRTLAVVSQYRFVPAWSILRDRISELGPSRVRARLVQTRSMAGIDRLDSWKRDPAVAGGGVLMGTAVHLIDLLLWLFGEGEVLAARTRPDADQKLPRTFETFAHVSWKGGRGDQVEFEALIDDTQTPVMSLEIETAHGTIAIADRRFRSRSVPLTWKARELLSGAVAKLSPARREPLGRQMLELVNAIQKGRNPAVTGEDGIAVLRLIEASYRVAAGSDPDSSV